MTYSSVILKSGRFVGRLESLPAKCCFLTCNNIIDEGTSDLLCLHGTA